MSVDRLDGWREEEKEEGPKPTPRRKGWVLNQSGQGTDAHTQREGGRARLLCGCGKVHRIQARDAQQSDSLSVQKPRLEQSTRFVSEPHSAQFCCDRQGAEFPSFTKNHVPGSL